MPDTVGVAGATAAAPSANTLICTLGDLADGAYELEVTTFVTGAAPTNSVNVELRDGTGTVSILPGVLNVPVTTKFIVTAEGTDAILLRTGAAAGGAGAIYVGHISARLVSSGAFS